MHNEEKEKLNQSQEISSPSGRSGGAGLIYFVSDAHLGSRLIENNREHEQKLVAWLDSIKDSASVIYLLGDMFDFWFEYRTVVPRGYVRFLGKLAEMVDSGIEIHFFIGNHDIWAFDYFEKEIGLIVHYEPYTVTHAGKTFYMRHGDGLSTDDHGFEFIRKIFHSKTLQKIFRYVPPQIGQNLGYWWSKKSRENISEEDNKYKGEEKEDIVLFSKKYVQTHDVDYLVFGHRHIILNLQLSSGEQVIILGDFVTIFSYGVFDGNSFSIEIAE